MGLVDRLYDVRCPLCDKATAVPGTILADIVQYLQDSSMGSEQLRLLCPACKRSFHFDYRERLKKAVGHEPLPLHTGVNHAWFAIEAECDPSNSCPPTTLI